MEVRERDTPSAQQSKFMKLFKQLHLEISLKDALIEMPKFNKWLSTLLRNKEKLEEIAITTIRPFSGSTTNHSNALPLSSSPVKTSDNPEKFADELTLLKKGVHEENFQVYSNPLFEFDDDFNSSNENPLFNEMVEDDENSSISNSDEPVLLNTPLSDKVECFDPEDNIDEIDAFLAMEVSSNFEEGYHDSEGDNEVFRYEDNELPNLDHQDNPSSPRPPPEPPDVCLNFKPDTAMKNDEDFKPQGEKLF
ncbi:hypothetical protein Tco_0412420 [Tanacetum coccineum]